MASQIYLFVAVALLSAILQSQAITEKTLNLSVVDEGIVETPKSNDTSVTDSSMLKNDSAVTETTVNPLNSTLVPGNLTSSPLPLGQNSSSSFKEEDCNPPKKVNTVYACNNQLNSTFTCSNAEFVLSAGKFIPCHSHDDCKPFQQPNDWCNLPWEYKYTNYGCYCDKKVGSCVIEREHRFTFSRQWAYCIARSEYKCDGKTECLL
ncbi:unnamed protein product [Auanema sp. JU1783]|nr:unnamed protein product [Auanema sp. JU1783]